MPISPNLIGSGSKVSGLAPFVRLRTMQTYKIALDLQNNFSNFASHQPLYQKFALIGEEQRALRASREDRCVFDALPASMVGHAGGRVNSYEPTVYPGSIRFYRNESVRNLRRFGNCNEKYIPDVIKRASRRQIRLFLDAFLQCDGSIRPPLKTLSETGERTSIVISRTEYTSLPHAEWRVIFAS